jgi:hypothetical protein
MFHRGSLSGQSHPAAQSRRRRVLSARMVITDTQGPDASQVRVQGKATGGIGIVRYRLFKPGWQALPKMPERGEGE